MCWGIRFARILRESAECPTVYGSYAQQDDSFLISLASARAGGKFRQKIAFQWLHGPSVASVEVWETAIAG